VADWPIGHAQVWATLQYSTVLSKFHGSGENSTNQLSTKVTTGFTRRDGCCCITKSTPHSKSKQTYSRNKIIYGLVRRKVAIPANFDWVWGNLKMQRHQSSWSSGVNCIVFSLRFLRCTEILIPINLTNQGIWTDLLDLFLWITKSDHSGFCTYSDFWSLRKPMCMLCMHKSVSSALKILFEMITIVCGIAVASLDQSMCRPWFNSRYDQNFFFLLIYTKKRLIEYKVVWNCNPSWLSGSVARPLHGGSRVQSP